MDSSPIDEFLFQAASTSAPLISSAEGEKQRSALAGKASQKHVEERLGTYPHN